MNFYATLEISADATLEEIKSSYQQLILIWHPDKASNSSVSTMSKEDRESKFRLILQAWRTLSDSALREEYDRELTRRNTAIIAAEDVPLSSFTLVDGTTYTLRCRCGDKYEITNEDIEEGYNTVQCNGCTLHITVT